MKNKVVELALNLDPLLLKHLINNSIMQQHFFSNVEGMLIFDKIKFQKFVSNKQFLPDSFTSFKNKIGLTSENEYLSSTKEVVLSWPYKDCILEGGQDKEDSRRSEVFWNEVLAPDQIDRLLSPKALVNFKKIDINGEHLTKSILGNENLIIRGNNLLALHTLHLTHSGQIKLIYIDPPYNTESDSFKYNDSFNHSTWLTFMKNRLTSAKYFLRPDGVIFVQSDDNEQAYLKVLMDEIFGDDNFINTISVNMKNVAGASGGGEDIKLKKNIEYIHIYAKDYISLKPFTDVYDYVPLIEMVEQYRLNDVSWKYTSVLFDSGEKEYVATTFDGGGDEIKIFKRNNAIFKSINRIMSDEGISEKDAYNKYAHAIHQTAMPQSSIRPRIMEKVTQLGIEGDLFSIEYVPRSGKNKGVIYEQFYKGDSFRLLAWLKDVSEVIDGVLYKKEKQGTYWNFVGETKNLTKEGSVELLSGKKPEKLLQRIIEMSTNEGDLVLDYHLGSGTTAAAAHKLNRRYIGIEQIDYGNNDSIVRLKNVINGDQSGVSKSVNWQGGGSFVYCELAKANQIYVETIQATDTDDKLIALWNEMQEKAFLSYKISVKTIDATKEDFKSLSVEDKKKFLIEVMDKNLLYVPLSEINDQSYAISAADKALNLQFFKPERA